MSFANMTWASGFRHIQPVEKFVLITLGNALGDRERGEEPPTMSLDHLPAYAGECNLPLDKFERIIEQLMKRGLIRLAPGRAIQLCTFVNPLEWNQRKEKPKDIPGNGTGKKRKK